MLQGIVQEQSLLVLLDTCYWTQMLPRLAIVLDLLAKHLGPIDTPAVR